MRIERCAAADIPDWARLRAELWQRMSVAAHAAELASMVGHAGRKAFIARDAAGVPIGFAEAALRHDHVNGCETSPVVFLEGVYVCPAARRRGVAARLCVAVAEWGRALGCQEFGSDAPAENSASHEFHRALGFDERERVVFFRRIL